MTLEKYWEKRDFVKTPEPRGEATVSGKRLSFFIQKHHASHLHYDFRLELDGTLKSWAVPKGPSLDPKDKRLAVHVEDHPVDYGLFEGDIPEKQYGAGHVIVWDTGTWSADGDALEAYRKGSLKFTLEGEKLSGRWALVRMGGKAGKGSGGKENWLLIKEKDEHARSGEEADVTARLPDSVLKKKRAAKAAGKNTADGGNAGDAPAKAGVKKTPAATAKTATAKTTKAARTTKTAAVGQKKLAVDAARVIETAAAVEAPMPEMIAPQLATLTDRPPAGDDWLCEVKFDGYRALCRIDDGVATLYSRNGNDWTPKWRRIADAAGGLPVRQAWLDGEVVAIDGDGNVSFQSLQNLARDDRPAQLAYYVFDLPYLNGYDLRQVPLLERRRLLEAVLADVDPHGPVLYSGHVQGDAEDVFRHASMHGLEGIIVKRADSVYASQRNASWLKVKCELRQEFVIGGYTDPAGAREKFGALLLGVFNDDGELEYVGRVGTGFDAALLESLHASFRKLASRGSPFVETPPRVGAPALHWLKPTLVAEVRFAQWTKAGIVRHASFIGLRQDKPAKAIRREQAVPVETLDNGEKNVGEGEDKGKDEKRNKDADKDNDAAGDKIIPGKRRAHTGGRYARSGGGGRDASVAGVRLSHPARVLFPDNGFTKLDLAKFYEDIADWILPHLAGRPLTLVRCPQGDGKQCFFQKHATETTDQTVEHIAVPGATYMTASSLPSLIGMVQMGVLELHTWGSRDGHLQQPDRIIFDLDPAPGLAWRAIVEAAQLVRALLDEIGLASFVKTTGGKGLHVVAPIKPDKDWERVKAFSKGLAEHLERELPDRFTASISKAKRGGRIFVDYLRNAAEATAVAAYSTRARPGAPVSVPVAWEELEGDLRSDTWNVGNLRERLAGLERDPWHDYESCRKALTAKMLKTFGA
jgi:bifunctional non-homologous end joining protein LigD